jgi:hypothetical protein
MNPAINIFCEPTPDTADISAVTSNLIQWSPDGVSWQSGNPPAGAFYLRVAVPPPTDISDAAYLNFGGDLAEVPAAQTGAGSQLVDTTVSAVFPAGIYDVKIVASDDSTVLYDAGTLAVI